MNIGNSKMKLVMVHYTVEQDLLSIKICVYLCTLLALKLFKVTASISKSFFTLTKLHLKVKLSHFLNPSQ